MSKITKNQRISTLERQLSALITLVNMKGYNAIDQRIEALEEFATYADNMLTELNHALPDPEYDAKCEAQEADIDASLDRHRERLGLNKPQLKQLDQSIFDGLDEKWRFAAIDKCGEVWYSTHRTQPSSSGTHLSSEPNADSMQARDYYDASNWQNSLIERDTAKELAEVDLSSELTGSELCKAMINRGDKIVLCIVRDYEYENDIYYDAITHCSGDYFDSTLSSWRYAVPINNQGEPLTAAEVGL